MYDESYFKFLGRLVESKLLTFWEKSKKHSNFNFL